MNKTGFKLESLMLKGNLLFSVGMLGIVFILVLPLPTWIIDALLSLSIAIAVLIITLISNIKKPTDFNVFPSTSPPHAPFSPRATRATSSTPSASSSCRATSSSAW
jgi:hypothetical protein